MNKTCFSWSMEMLCCARTSRKIDVLLIENVERIFTKTIIGMKNLNYEDRLKSLNLPNLEFPRQTRGDMIETIRST